MLKEYLAYIKDNPEGYWFKRKFYGWGWTPAKWQGWFVILTFVGFVIWSGADLTIHGEVPTQTDLYWFFGKIILATILMIWICYKTGEKPKWQWGIPRKEESEKEKTPEL